MAEYVTYVLMVVIFSNGFSSSFSHEFSTKATCEVAAKSIEAKIPPQKLAVTFCEKK